MSPESAQEKWSTANQRCLMAELAVLSRLLRGETGEGPELQALREARAVMPAPPALDTLCAMFGLSEFERRILLLCAGVEIDGQFSNRSQVPAENRGPRLASR